MIAHTCKYWNISFVSAVFIEIFQHNQQYDTLLPITPCAHKLKAGIAYCQNQRAENQCFEFLRAWPINVSSCILRVVSTGKNQSHKQWRNDYKFIVESCPVCLGLKLRLHATINRLRFVFWRMSSSKHA